MLLTFEFRDIKEFFSIISFAVISPLYKPLLATAFTRMMQNDREGEREIIKFIAKLKLAGMKEQ